MLFDVHIIALLHSIGIFCPAGVVVSLTGSSVAVSEEDGLVNITLMLTGAHSVPITVTVTTISGTAIGITHIICTL